MPEYRLSQEKNGIKVEMVVTVNGTVKVGFLITNNYGGCFVDLKYYDTLGNTKTVRVQTVKGDLNKSTGVIAEFPKPSKSFDVCFDIVNITTCEPYPKPQIVSVIQTNPIFKGYDILGEPIYEYQGVVLWENGQQKVVPVFQTKDGLRGILGYSRDRSYWYPISSVKIFLPCFSGGYQWAVISLKTEINNTCVDCYTDIVVYPEGGYIDVSDRKYRDYYEDYYFNTYLSSVSLVKKSSVPDFSVCPSEIKREIEIPVDCNLVAFVVCSLPSGKGIKVYHNNELIHERYGWCVGYLITVRRNFKAGDKLVFVPVDTCVGIQNLAMYDYVFKEIFDNIYLTAFYSSYSHKATIKAVCVPEEFADEYIGWLKNRGYNAVKINPQGTHSL